MRAYGDGIEVLRRPGALPAAVLGLVVANVRMALPNRSITSEVRLNRLFCARHHSLHKMGPVPSAQGQCCPARRDKCASLRQ
jgi:hypothetical protein